MDKVTGLFGTIKNGFTNLTKREQIMVYGLVIIVVLAVLIFLIIMPALTNISKLTSEVSEYQTKEMEMRMTIAESSSYDQRSEDATKNFKKLKKQFFVPMDPESLDETITAIIVQSGLTPKDLQMTGLQQGQIPIYKIQPLAAAGVVETVTGEAAESSSESTDSSGSDDEDSSDATDAYVYTVTVVAEGDKSNLSRLIDIVNETSGIKLNSYNFALSSETSDTDEVTMGGSVNLEFYVYVYVDNTSGVTYEPMSTEENAEQ